MTNNWWLNDERRASIVCLSMDERENMAKTVCFFLADERFISFLFPTFNYTFRCVHAQFSNTIILSDPKALVLHNVLFTQHTQKKCATEQAIHELESERFIFFFANIRYLDILTLNFRVRKRVILKIVKHSPQREKGRSSRDDLDEVLFFPLATRFRIGHSKKKMKT